MGYNSWGQGQKYPERISNVPLLPTVLPSSVLVSKKATINLETLQQIGNFQTDWKFLCIENKQSWQH